MARAKQDMGTVGEFGHDLEPPGWRSGVGDPALGMSRARARERIARRGEAFLEVAAAGSTLRKKR